MSNKPPRDYKEFLSLLEDKIGVFKPTGTSQLLAHAVEDYIESSYSLKVLDLGCGNGVIALYLKSRFQNIDIFASDISEKAVAIGKKNAKKLNLSVTFFQSNLFNALSPEDKYDLIINDVSGISVSLAKLSDWFIDVPCDSGQSGISLTRKVLQQSKKFLNKDGVLILPVISLSDTTELMLEAKKHFNNIQELAHQEWPLVSPNSEFISTAKDLKERGKINYEERYGKFIFTTKVIALSGQREF